MRGRSCGLSLLSGPRTDDASFGTNPTCLMLFLGLAPSSTTSRSEQHLQMGSALSGRREATVLPGQPEVDCRTQFSAQIYPPLQPLIRTPYLDDNRINHTLPRHLKPPSRSPFPPHPTSIWGSRSFHHRPPNYHCYLHPKSSTRPQPPYNCSLDHGHARCFRTRPFTAPDSDPWRSSR